MTQTRMSSWYAEKGLESKLWNSEGELQVDQLEVLASKAPEGFEDQLFDAMMSLIEDMHNEGHGRGEISRAVFHMVFTDEELFENVPSALLKSISSPTNPRIGDLAAMLRVCGTLRDSVKRVLLANLKSWERGSPLQSPERFKSGHNLTFRCLIWPL